MAIGLKLEVEQEVSANCCCRTGSETVCPESAGWKPAAKIAPLWPGETLRIGQCPVQNGRIKQEWNDPDFNDAVAGKPHGIVAPNLHTANFTPFIASFAISIADSAMIFNRTAKLLF